MFWVYIVKCNDNSYYTGQTGDVEKRIGEHNEGVSQDCYTFKRRPVELVYSGYFPTREEAFEFERQIKGWSRAKKEALIRGDFAEIKRLGKKTGKS